MEEIQLALHQMSAREAHYAAIGKVIANWAAFEYFIQSAIWCFANVNDDVGVCLTAQRSYEGLLMSLIALAKLNGANDEQCKKLNFFIKRSKDLAARRNSHAHNAVYFDQNASSPSRLVILAKKKKFYGYESDPTDTIDRLVDDIHEHVNSFQTLIEDIAASLSIELWRTKTS